MKKLLITLLVVMMSVTGCSRKKEVVYDTDIFKEYFLKSTGEMTTWNYLNQATTTNTQVLVNIISGALDCDRYGVIVNDLAQNVEHNDDYSVWTITLKKGMPWQVIDGKNEDGEYVYKKYAEVTAHDFVYGAKWILDKDNASECFEMHTSTIKNAREYYDGKIKNWDQVGIKALDDYTIQYTLKSGMAYFESVLLYPAFYPVNEKFVKEMGDTFGSSPETILYNGAYLIGEYQNDTYKTMVANDKYWDYNSITIPTIEWIAVKDAELTKEYFERGELSYCTLTGTQPEAEAKKENEYMYRTDPYACNYTFFLNNQAEDENVRKAMNNENFRRALYYGIDRYEFVSLVDPLEPESLYCYTYTAENFATLSDGTDYTDLPELARFKENPYNPDLARIYLNRAKKELGDSVSWPIKLGWYYKSGNETSANTAILLRDILETTFDDEVTLKIGEYSTNARKEVYASELNGLALAGWVPDYGDLTNVLYSILHDGYMNNSDNSPAAMSGWYLEEFEKLYYDAASIIDTDERLKAFAKAEAYMLENMYIIPIYQAGSVYRMSTVNEYSRNYSLTGGVQYRYKGMEIFDHVVTAKQQAEFREEWHQKRVELGLTK